MKREDFRTDFPRKGEIWKLMIWKLISGILRKSLCISESTFYLQVYFGKKTSDLDCCNNFVTGPPVSTLAALQ